MAESLPNNVGQSHFFFLVFCRRTVVGIINTDADKYQSGIEMCVRQNQAGGFPRHCFLSDVWLHEPRRIAHKQYLGWGARGGGGRDGWGEGGGGGELPSQKRSERLEVSHAGLRAITQNAGILLKSVPANLHTHGGSTSRVPSSSWYHTFRQHSGSTPSTTSTHPRARLADLWHFVSGNQNKIWSWFSQTFK